MSAAENLTSSSNHLKTALVTGSSSGIGRAIVLKLASQGWRVVLHGRSRSKNLLATLVEVQQMGGEAAVCECDFSDIDQLEPFVESAWSQFGSLDAWINNAGGDVLTGNWASRSLSEKLKYLLTVDVSATLLLSRLVGQKMIRDFESNPGDENRRENDFGRFSILNMGWDQAMQGMAGESGELFATTKGAIIAMTKSLAQSLAPAVRVNCLAPGWIQTAWGDQTSKYWDQRAKRESLMNRWGQVEDVAAAAGFLCSDEARFISGQILPINGGFRYATT